MKKIKSSRTFLLLVTILVAAAVVGCVPPGTPAGDTTRPTVISTIPIDTAMDVPLNGTINATFSEAMNAATMVAANFSLAAGGTVVAGAVVFDEPNKTMTFTPTAALTASTLYTATITTGAKDLVGNTLAVNTVWSFSTGATSDTTAPTVLTVSPADLATNVAIDSTITATFSEGMDVSTMLNAANFTVAAGTTAVSGTVAYNVQNKKAIFAPASNLVAGTTYTATIAVGAKDLAGNALAAAKVWTFETIPASVAAAALGPAPVRLGTAGNFAILAKTAISTVPASVITGDIGVSPAAETYLTGFSQTKATGYSTSPQVTGLLYAADMTPPTPWYMTTAVSDMEAAYTDAAGRSDAPVNDLSAGTIGGLTFAPGLYKWGSNVLITTDIYINGAANDVWIFQMSGNLIVSSAQKVILQGAAQAKNIFWQVAGYAELGTTSVVEGTILSQTQIKLLTGSTLNGRALAQTQVTLDTATVTKP